MPERGTQESNEPSAPPRGYQLTIARSAVVGAVVVLIFLLAIAFCIGLIVGSSLPHHSSASAATSVSTTAPLPGLRAFSQG